MNPDDHRADAPGPAPSHTGPGRGAGEDPGRAAPLHARIAIVATIVLGQLWALTVALNAWFEGRTTQVWVLLAFQMASFVAALAVYLASPRDR